jgi:hypothetical protein
MLAEGADLLCEEGNVDAAIRLESPCAGIIETRPVDILCMYPLATLHRHHDDYAFNSICAAHTAVFSR